VSHTHAESDVTNLVTDLSTLQSKTSTLPVLTPFDQSAWSWLNQGSSTVSVANGMTHLSLAPAASATLRGRFVALSSPYTITAAIIPKCFANALSTPFVSGFGLFFHQSSSGKIVQFTPRAVGGTGIARSELAIERWTSTTAFSLASAAFALLPFGVIWLRIGHDGTTLTYSASTDGFNFTQLFSESATAFMLTTGPDKVGIIGRCDSIDNTGGGSVLSWVQS
jgi:hypothetical protein